MFTGIIREKGIIANIEKFKTKTIFTINSKQVLKNKKIGDSIAVNGVCVTATKKNENSFSFDAIKETLNKTNFKFSKKGDKVNLESALTLQSAIDGHLVQGHVDNTGTVKNLSTVKNRKILTIEFPKELKKYMALKGSIAINGVSLTISELGTKTLSVDLIPLTTTNTNLGSLKKGDKVNLEIDIIARYLEKIIKK